ncbi:F0F1-type ATP synthase beta subunit [Paraburkholderia bryophila]|uniref:F0F1-type ATP synthase beta subunit n=1 Tax=Paraburkholderia bryophila TaxID=420952 RepID=A0A7Y9W5L0_9BURK|nr:F0F1-type ATP synthase beta subunit [Paraburkholderia bryophila]
MSVGDVSVTAIEAVYVPADDFTDPAVTAIAAHIDSMIVLSRSMAAEGMYPAIDPIASSSILLDPLVVGEEHAAVATEVRRIIEHYRERQDVISLLGIEQLGAEDRALVGRARRLRRFLTQPLPSPKPLRAKQGAPWQSLTRSPAARQFSPASAIHGRKARST